MYRVTHLSKSFKNKRELIKAVDDVSFTLPNNGMHFIIGKSGSGKSTLLNLLGALEKCDQGEMYFNDIKISDLPNKESAYFRNQIVGFMFQDFCLFEDMTVYQNIELSLTLKGYQNNDAIIEIMKKLEIYDLQHTKVIKLSVGQKERVALARAIIKNPKVLLCDEPTGNLDSETSRIILDFLKEISKNILVVIITHNLFEAYKYADRIIELNEGKIKKDIVYPFEEKDALLIGDTLYLNDLKSINNNKKEQINKIISKKEAKNIKHIENLFINKEEDYKNKEEIKLEKQKMTFGFKFKLHHRLFKKEYLRNIFFTCFSVFLVVAFTLCEMLIFYNKNDNTISEINSLNLPSYNLLKLKEENESKELVGVEKITQSEKEKIKDKSFPLSTFTFVNRNQFHTLGLNQINVMTYKNFDRFYSSNNYGTLYGLTKEDIPNLFEDQSVYVEDINPYKKEGFYLTDYSVDAYRFYVARNFDPKEKLSYPNNSLITNGYCNGIIHTNYKIKFKNILSKLDKTSLLLDVLPREELDNFINYASRFLAIQYSFEGNFNELVNNLEVKNNQGAQKVLLNEVQNSEGIKLKFLNKTYYHFESRNLGDYEILLPVRILNENNENSKTVKEWNDLLANKEFEFITGENNESIKVTLSSYGDASIFVGKEVIKFLTRIYTYDYGMYFLDSKEAISAIRSLDDDSYKFMTLDAEIRNRIYKTIAANKDFFSFFMYILFIASLLTVIFLGIHNVSRLKYKIGILKGLGINKSDLFNIFILNGIYISASFIVLFYPLMFAFKDLANTVLLESFKKTFVISNLSNINLFVLSPFIIFTNISLIVVILLISILVPLFKVNSIKPIDILKRL